RAVPGEVFLSSACDGWQPVEKEYRLTRRCCQLLLEYGFEIHVLTKSSLVLRDLDVLTGQKARVGVSVTTLDETLCKLWEPEAATVDERFHVLQEARHAGLRTAIMFGPLLPWLSDQEESLEAMFRRAADLDIDAVWVDALNSRPKVWPAVAELLRAQFPGMVGQYRRMLFDEQARAGYLAEVRQRVQRAARRTSLEARIAWCF
ncbi:MAG: SPL family radical SAM protein, partial [Thermoguttaceae bacterium]